MTLTNLEIFEQLDELVKDLLWMSESDYPFEVFIWEFGEGISLNNEIVLKITKHSLETTVKVIEFEVFFRLVIREKDWHNAEEYEVVRKYQKLVSMMKQYLSDLKVYKVGEVRKDVYIVGKTNTGDYAGIATVSIET
ncbi:MULTISPECIES: nuclease A inhibitor family protein [Okeania]|nr:MULTISPECIES: nuclease A inhibitor family protein [Okeania]NEP74887.1 nuclease [Okeania sp. SIO2G5]NEP94993.1 nuclease [Okeania sp. SIO2F5]NEQ91485.1 nuclease [Okeania sp. SIO2G4]NES78832.1 nuclease [Okeania sp. SIO1H4]NET22342.1 nuclease [Okeania sp. SIO1H5]